MFNALSIRQKLYLLPILITITMLGEVALVTYSLAQNDADASIINIAGRQRMLTKKFLSEELFRAENPEQSIPSLLAANSTEALYRESLKALHYGGKTYSDLAMTQPIELPKPSHQPYIEQLILVEQAWQAQLEKARLLQSDISDSNAEAFLIANHKALATMNTAVKIYTQYARSKLDLMVYETLFLALVMIIAGFVLARAVINNTTNTIDLLVRVSREISLGNLSKDNNLSNMSSKDELGKLAYNIGQMRQSLQDTLNEIQLTSTNINLSSTQVSDLSAQISQANRNEQQHFININDNSLALEQSSLRLREITTDTLEKVTQCNELSAQASQMVANNIANMQTTSDETQRASQFIQELSQTAEQVYGIVDAIKAISEQTNLLALNAAIEAARAGEQGRGFAVVADEVRGLAARTGESTNEIAKLITQLTEGVKQVVTSMQEVSERVATSRNTSEQTATGIHEVNDRIQLVAQAQQQIDEQVDQQVSQLEQLKATQSQLEVIINESFKKSETSSLVAKQLAGVSRNVTDLIQHFSLDTSLTTVAKEADCGRSHPRVATGLHFELIRGDYHTQGLTEDISYGGTRLIVPTDFPLELGQKVDLVIDYLVDNQAKKLAITGKLIHKGTQSDNKHYVHIDFTTPSVAQKQALTDIFSTLKHSGQFASG